MAPKRNQQKQKSSSSKGKSQSSSSSSTGVKLQITAENENRLRRLLLNAAAPAPPVRPAAGDSISKAQKAKQLRSIYEKLSCEGFSDDQIERALSALKEGASFEAALDWLCLNLPGSELPLKFSTGTSLYTNEGSAVGIISTARDDWSPPMDSAAKIEEDTPEITVRIKGRSDDDTLDSCQPSQADWIRQYVEQQEEDESETWGANSVGQRLVEAPESRVSCDSLVREYHSARLEAINAKERGDKKGQQQAGQIIRKLKQELSALGLSDDMLASGHVCPSLCPSEDASYGSMPSEDPEPVTLQNEEGDSASVLHAVVSKVDAKLSEGCISMDLSPEQNPANVPVQALEEESGNIELGNFFVDDVSSSGVLPPEVVNLQKQEKMREFSIGKNIEKLEGIWKKGDPQRIPKAVLQQLCRKSGWEAPKYERASGKENNFSYSVSILRKASGRGKSRKAGGLVTLQLPSHVETLESAEDAQNKLAAFALYHLFTDLPVHLLITEPYASLVLHWKEGETSIKIGDSEEDRRADFVDSLLKADDSKSIASGDALDDSIQEKSHKPLVQENVETTAFLADPKAESFNYHKEAESSCLRQELENKRKTQRYKVMLESRAALPIAELKSDILRLLKENNVLVVCGETGSGKTTQVPQYILDDMIETGRGGHCNIICTQPRRIAAISVAERVADERCESSPGSNGSLVGYQVRLDSARNERTKLLFCTTGILLRNIAGNKNLSGVTHIIVDEVHERSLLTLNYLLIWAMMQVSSASPTKRKGYPIYLR